MSQPDLLLTPQSSERPETPLNLGDGLRDALDGICAHEPIDTLRLGLLIGNAIAAACYGTSGELRDGRPVEKR